MTISYVAAGTLATGTTSITPTHPAGLLSGDLEVMQLVSGHPSGSAPSTPAGWEKVADIVGGDPAVYGVGTGPRRAALYTRIAGSSNPNPTIAMPAGTNVFVAARIHALRRSAGTGWRYGVTTDEDIASGTFVGLSGIEPLTYRVNDFVFSSIVLPSQTPTLSAQALSATNVTFGTVTERNDDAVANGAQARLTSATATATAVTGTVSTDAASSTATASVATFGVGALLRVREATATITATAQTAFPPRVLVAVSGMATEDIEAITLERSALNSLEVVRAADSVDVTGVDAFVRTDGELPFGVPVAYQATLKDAGGFEWTILSGSVTVNAENEVLSDPIQGIGVDVQIMSWKERRYERETSLFNVAGRLVVVSGPNPGATSDLVLFTKLTDDADKMLDLLDNATNGIVQLRTQAAAICLVDPEYDVHAEVDAYLAVLGTVVARVAKFRYPQRNWSLTVAEVDPWPAGLEARGWTYADVDTHFTDQTYAAFDTLFNLQKYLAVDTRDWGV